jgi:SAM-dependent methyltransferase
VDSTEVEASSEVGEPGQIPIRYGEGARTKTEWWQSFFGGLWEDAQLGLWSEEDNRAAADMVERALRLSSPARVLDAPCGDGRIARGLASRGYDVTGVDLNETFLAQATKRAREQGVSVKWKRGDMRDLPFRDEFEAALNFGGSFGYFDDLGNTRTAAAAYRSLGPGGQFLIDLPAPETIFPRFRERSWYAAGRLLVLTENRYAYEKGRIESDWTVIAPNGTRERMHSSVRLYTYRELAELLRGVGFANVEGFDPENLASFGVGASRLVVVATK